MKKLVMLLLILPLVAGAQSKKDFKEVMDKFVQYYNAGNTDMVCSLFPEKEDNGCFWRFAEERGSKSLDEYGKIIAYQYLGVDKTDPEKVTVFRIETEQQGIKAMSFTLGRGNKFGTFRFITSSEEIERMLAEVK